VTRLPWLIVLIVVGSCFLHAAEGDWKVYTAKRDIKDLTAAGTTLWGATSGGAFSYSAVNGTFQEFTTSEGLRSTDLTAVAIDSAGGVWFGASNGYLHRYLPSTGSWRYLSDIADRQIPQKSINALRVHGDSLFICSDFGLSVVRISTFQFGDSYSLFGPPASRINGNVVDMMFYHDSLFLATNSGVCATSLLNPNPSVPESWNVSTHLQGLLSDNVTALAVFHDTLCAATAGGLVYYNAGYWYAVPGAAGLSVADVATRPGSLSDAEELRFIAGGTLYRSVVLGAFNGFTGSRSTTLTRLSRDRSNAVGTTTEGIAIADPVWSYLTAPGPASNNFVGLAVDERGGVWSGTGIDTSDGFLWYDGKKWKYFTHATDARIGKDGYYKVSIGPDDSKWVSNWGDGVAILNDNGVLQRVVGVTAGLPPTIDAAPPARSQFVVVGGVATAADGVTWITSRTPPGDTSIVLFEPDSSLRYVVGCGPGCRMRNPYNVFTDVAIDQNGTKWFANFSYFEPYIPNRVIGFYYYNERVALPGTSNGWGRLTTTDGLTSSQVWSLAVDPDNALWIGTDQGISIIFDPSDPQKKIAAYHPLRDQVIQAMAVDPLNNKWIGTKQGVFVLSSDGTVVLNHYTVANTAGKLLDDDIVSIAVDRHSGTVYFGTPRGLSSLGTPAVAPVQSFGELAFTPNPYHLPAVKQMMIDGLVQGSTIKILRVDGMLVRELPTPGGRVAYWDGKDSQGNIVPTGIYVVVAYGEDGSSVAKGKIAVIRK
jgi:ligand-binding sensor domain-containing protein